MLRILGVSLCLLVGCGGAPSAPPPTGNGVMGIDHLGLAVPDLEAAKAFFTDALGFSVKGQDAKYPAYFLKNGHTVVTIWQADVGATPFNRRTNIGLHHFALALDSFAALDALHATLKAWPGVTIEFAPELSYGGPAKHMMFRSPGGIRMELIHRP